jgi:hypothetical protein
MCSHACPNTLFMMMFTQFVDDAKLLHGRVSTTLALIQSCVVDISVRLFTVHAHPCSDLHLPCSCFPRRAGTSVPWPLRQEVTTASRCRSVLGTSEFLHCTHVKA